MHETETLRHEEGKKSLLLSGLNRHFISGRLLPLVLFFFFFSFFSQRLHAQAGAVLGSLSSAGVDASADNLEVVGTNLIGDGHAVIKYDNILITADKVIIDFESWNIEALGRVRFVRREKNERQVDLSELEKLEEDPKLKVELIERFTTPTGRQKARITVQSENALWEGERAEGNLKTGYFNLGHYIGRFEDYYCIGESAEREPDSTITVKNARVSTCEYLFEDHDHYSITAGRLRLVPQEGYHDFKQLRDGSHERFDVWAYNCVFWIGNVPILWVPVLYKPGKGSFGWQIQAGQDHDWGYFVKTRKTFRLYDYPNVTGTLLADWYSRRGFGVGTNIKARTDNTRTDAFIYWIYDRDPQMYEGRFDIKPNRYELKLSHMNHLTPRMDFRGQIDKLSDINFLSDFMRRRNETDPQPVTFADLEYQFDHFSLSANVRPRVNNFFSEVQRLPELRLDIQRQELFKNIYYQGETTFDYLMMSWRKYDKPRLAGNMVDPKDYESARFDTLHMFYYPFSIDWLNLLPRAGFRLTYYSKSSKKKINQDDVDAMYTVDNDGQGEPPGDVVNYDSKGGDKFRFTGELGLEGNTKIYRAWNDVKSPFLELDGLRHVIQPYFNYEFLPSPSVSREKLYYFDDIDRITEQNFLRLGMLNRLQTRRGEVKRQEIFTWASMENYIDFHFNQQEGFNNFGDFGTIFEFNPTSDFTIRSDILIDSGNATLDKIKTDFIYNITSEWKLVARHNYQDNYEQRGAYSMGSSLTDITSGTDFSRKFTKNHEVTFGIEFPINKKTRGEFFTTYNIYYGAFEEARIKLIRKLHCWEAAIEYALRQRKTDMGEASNQHNFMFMLYLTAAPSVKIEARQAMGGDEGGEGDEGGGEDGGGGGFGSF